MRHPALLGPGSAKQEIRPLIFLCCFSLHVLKMLPLQPMLPVPVLDMTLDKSHHIFIWVSWEGPSSKDNKEKWFSTQIRASQIFLSVYILTRLRPNTHKWKTGSEFLYKETCVAQAVDCFTSGRKELQITNKKLSHYPSLPTPPEQIKAALSFWKPQTTVRQKHIYCLEINPLSTQLEQHNKK